MADQRRVLIVEDSDDDAQLLLRELRRAGHDPLTRRVETIAGVKEAMQEGPWDLVLSDFNLPQQNFSEIIETIRSLDADVPVIVISGSIGEENAVALMSQGVADFVFKGNLSRLFPAMERELSAAAAQIARREADRRFRDIVEVSGDWIWETDEEHRFTFFSTRYEEAEWADPTASLGRTPWEVSDADLNEDEHWQAHLAERAAHQPFRNFLYSFVTPSGSRHHVSMSGVPIFDRGGNFKGYRGTATDQTPIVAAFWRAEEAEALLTDAVESISEGFVIFDADDRIVMANEAYRLLYPEISDLARPGVSFEDFLQAGIERGAFPEAKGRESQWIADRLQVHRELAESSLHRVSDGRWVLATERRMSNGGIAGLRMDITALKKAEAQRDHLADHDATTGLPNKARFTGKLEKALGEVRQKGEVLAVACLELSSLHDIRDSLGLAAGDQALCEVANRLSDVAAVHEPVAHIGGGHFLALRLGISSEAEAIKSVEDLLAPFEEPFRIGETQVPLRVSIGVSTTHDDTTDPDALIRNATTAMRRARKMPFGRYQFYSDEMTKVAVARATIEGDLRRAVENDELFVVYQPQVSAHGYRLVGAEALVRWQHPARGLIPPSDFIPIAEEIGLIGALGERVLDMVCRQAKLWRDRGARIPLSVNLSALQLSEPNLDGRILSIVQAAGVTPDAIMLELTESAIVRDAAAAGKTMRRLSGEGIRFALDDFGMQHSALSHLSDMPFDTLKIDKAFVARMTESRGHAALFQAIVAMIHSLGMTAVAEGVEEASQLIYLQAYGCDTLQGYLFSRPLVARDFEPFLSSRIIVPSVHGTDTPLLQVATSAKQSDAA